MTAKPRQPRRARTPATSSDLHAIANEAATKAASAAIHDTFVLLGVDLTKSEDIEAFRADMAYARKLRRLADQGAAVAFRIVVGAICIGIIGYLASNVPGLNFLRFAFQAGAGTPSGQ